MYLMIDNYDSFVHNLSVYFRELGKEICLVRNDDVSMREIQELLDAGDLEGIIISPGPKSPDDCGKSLDVVRTFAGRIPILGVCLGHQIIGYAWNAKVGKAKRPMHGKVTEIQNTGRSLFENLPSRYQVTRYHSLIVKREELPGCLEVDAVDLDGTIMAISHQTLPVYGVQFHPEAVLTEYGHALLSNYIKICKEFKETNENIRCKAASL